MLEIEQTGGCLNTMDIKLGYQIYSAREEAEKDLAGVCEKLKAFGYDGVEFAGFYGYTAEQINEILGKTGLAAVSSHVPYASIVEDMQGTIAFHKAIGCKYIAVPYLDEETRPGAPGFAAAIRNIYKFGALCRAEGIQLLYHNHDFEFVKLSGQYGLDFLYDAVPADLLATELDTCCRGRRSLRLHPQVRRPLPGRAPEGLRRLQEGGRGALRAHPGGRLGRRQDRDRKGTRL